MDGISVSAREAGSQRRKNVKMISILFNINVSAVVIYFKKYLL